MKFALLLLALIATTCKPTPAPAPAPPMAAPDAGSQVDDASKYTCARACAHQQTLKCKLAEPTPKGTTCEEACAVFQDEPPGLAWDLKCLTTATKCAVCK